MPMLSEANKPEFFDEVRIGLSRPGDIKIAMLSRAYLSGPADPETGGPWLSVRR
jgi:hypothetical protein